MAHKLDFYLTWRWQYLRRNKDFQDRLAAARASLLEAWHAGPFAGFPERPDDAGQSVRQENTERETPAFQRPDGSFLVFSIRRWWHDFWLEADEYGSVTFGQVHFGILYRCPDLDMAEAVSRLDAGENIPRPEPIQATAPYGIVRAQALTRQGWSLQPDFNAPQEHTQADLRHMQRVWSKPPFTEKNRRHHILEQSLEAEQAAPQGRYSREWQRAAGVWLIDAMDRDFISCAEAMRRAPFHLEADEKTIQNWTSGTRKCIAAGEVLPLK